MAERWTTKQAQKWYDQRPYLQGVNYIPRNAVNTIDMWMNLDIDTIKEELKWAHQTIRYNAVRIFLNDLVWRNEGETVYLRKVEQFLEVASDVGMLTTLVVFDGRLDPNPVYGTQNDPIPAVHNSRWVQTPGKDVLQDRHEYKTILRPYVESIVKNFGNHSSVCMIDLWNQPDNDNRFTYGSEGTRTVDTRFATDTELDKVTKTEALLYVVPHVMHWARSVGPIKAPLTIAVWNDIPSPKHDSEVEDDEATYRQNQRELHDMYLEFSDVVTLQHYSNQDDLKHQIHKLQKAQPDRPIVVSSYLARTEGSTLDPILGHLYNESIWAFNEGLVDGKTQTNYPPDSWNIPGEYMVSVDPDPWYQNVLKSDGTPYLQSEKDFLTSYKNLDDGGASLYDTSSPETINHIRGGSLLSIFSAFIILVEVVILIGLILFCRHCWKRRQRHLRLKELDSIPTPGDVHRSSFGSIGSHDSPTKFEDPDHALDAEIAALRLEDPGDDIPPDVEMKAFV